MLHLQVAVIMSNPEQSKHLETARMTVDGLELDLVNLRSETYTDSRIPEMTFGTPQQDAERRDFTINSLFYNLNTSQVASCSNPETRQHCTLFCMAAQFASPMTATPSLSLRMRASEHISGLLN